VHIGRQAIRGFYGAIENVKAQTEVFTLRALGNEAAFHWTLTPRLRRQRDAHRHHQHDDVRRGRQDRVDEGVLDQDNVTQL